MNSSNERVVGTNHVENEDDLGVNFGRNLQQLV
jgi:hypothetical protein